MMGSSFGLITLALSLLIILLAFVIGPAIFATRAGLRIIGASRLWGRSANLGLGLGMVGAVIWAHFTMVVSPLIMAVLCLLLLHAVLDLRWRWLPIEWSGLIALAALLNTGAASDLPGVILGMLAPAFLLFAMREALLRLRGLEALGLGDIWLTAALSGFLSVTNSFLLIGLAAASGLIEVALRLAFGAKSATKYGVAYGAHLSFVFVILYFFAPPT